MNTENEKSETIKGINLIYRTGYRITEVVIIPPRLTPEERKSLLQDLHHQMKNMDWYYAHSDSMADIKKGEQAMKSLCSHLEKLAVQRGGGPLAAQGLWFKYAPSSGVKKPAFLNELENYNEDMRAFIPVAPATPIEWQHLPNLSVIKLDLQHRLESGDLYFAIPRLYNEHRGPCITTFNDLDDALEYGFVKKITNDYNYINTLTNALKDIDQRLAANKKIRMEWHPQKQKTRNRHL